MGSTDRNTVDEALDTLLLEIACTAVAKLFAASAASVEPEVSSTFRSLGLSDPSSCACV